MSRDSASASNSGRVLEIHAGPAGGRRAKVEGAEDAEDGVSVCWCASESGMRACRGKHRVRQVQSSRRQARRVDANAEGAKEARNGLMQLDERWRKRSGDGRWATAARPFLRSSAIGGRGRAEEVGEEDACALGPFGAWGVCVFPAASTGPCVPWRRRRPSH